MGIGNRVCGLSLGVLGWAQMFSLFPDALREAENIRTCGEAAAPMISS